MRAKYVWIGLMLILIGVFLPACGESSQPVVPTQETVIPTAARTNTPLPEPTLTMTITPTEPVSEAYETRCVRMLDELPEINDLEGRIIIQEQQWGADIYHYIYDLDTDTQVNLDALFDTLVVSPDHSMVAYLDDSYRRLFVSDIDGNVIQNFFNDPVNPGQDQSLIPVQWLDNQHILMFARGEGEYPNNLAPYAAIFDLAAGKSENIAMDLPHINQNYHEQGARWNFGWVSEDYRLVISPDQEYFVYPAREDSSSFLIIWDRDNAVEVSRFPGIMPWHTVPRWSPDGERFAVMAIEEGEIDWWENEEISGDEIFLIDRFGNFEKITAFEAEAPGNISFLSWSPDGQKIAFWIDFYHAAERDSFGGKLLVVDLETETVIDYCIEGRREIFWSLDGNNLFIRKTLEGYESYEVYSIILVNLEDLWAATLMDFAEVEGVLKEE